MKKTMYILMSHDITKQQINNARAYLDVDNFVTLPIEAWSQIPADFETVDSSLLPLKAQLLAEAKEGDILLVQGDYGATFNMVQFAKEMDMVPVYATTRRKVSKRVDGEKTITTRAFEHVRFRKY
ncbi:MAG: CRISPR-associated protein Csx20 [Sulfurovum sp.]|nr:CRISPR-associated protein Csx20 [Sulfurovum sp.]